MSEIDRGERTKTATRSELSKSGDDAATIFPERAGRAAGEEAFRGGGSGQQVLQSPPGAGAGGRAAGFETPDDVYYKFFKDRENRGTDAARKRYDDILQNLDAKLRQTKGTGSSAAGAEMNMTKKSRRIAPSKWWTQRTDTELLPRLLTTTTTPPADAQREQEQQKAVSDIDITATGSDSNTGAPAATSRRQPQLKDLSCSDALVQQIPFLRAEEVKRLMLYDAQRQRSLKQGGDPTSPSNRTLDPALWARFTRRAWELTTGTLYPTRKRVGRRCHVRSVLRFLQALASVQFYPETDVVLSVTASSNGSNSSSTESGGTPPASTTMRASVLQQMIRDMFLACVTVSDRYNRLKRQQLVFLLHALARLQIGHGPKSIFFYDSLSPEEAENEQFFSPMKGRIILSQLKAVTVLELLPHRVADVVKLWLHQMDSGAAAAAPASASANERNLVLFELFLRLEQPEGAYEGKLSETDRRKLEERRDAYYERVGMYGGGREGEDMPQEDEEEGDIDENDTAAGGSHMNVDEDSKNAQEDQMQDVEGRDLAEDDGDTPGSEVAGGNVFPQAALFEIGGCIYTTDEDLVFDGQRSGVLVQKTAQVERRTESAALGGGADLRDASATSTSKKVYALEPRVQADEKMPTGAGAAVADAVAAATGNSAAAAGATGSAAAGGSGSGPTFDKQKFAELLQNLDVSKLNPKMLERLTNAGTNISEHEDALSTLSSGETWKDLHDIFATRKGNVDLKDPDVLNDVQQITEETKLASKMFSDAYESVAGILKELHLTPEETKGYLEDTKVIGQEILGELHPVSTMDELENVTKIAEAATKFL
eukprot:g5439.t1